ncbi:3-hydroxyacyl-CoA dehydrogenase, NAD binding domain protein [Ostertagia ostertagi]
MEVEAIIRRLAAESSYNIQLLCDSGRHGFGKRLGRGKVIHNERAAESVAVWQCASTIEAAWQTRTAAAVKKKLLAVMTRGNSMGRRYLAYIALCRAGYDTTLVENNMESLEVCRRELKTTYAREKKLGRLSSLQCEKLEKGIHLTTDLNSLKNCDLVIEAVFEKMKLKTELFTKLSQICKPTTIFATNTSSLNIDEMSSALQKPERLVGMHFFNPAHIIRMVEVVFGPGSDISLPLGMLPNDVDALFKSFGLIMGPLTVADMNGLDVAALLKSEHNYPLNPIEKELLQLNRLGRKTGKGKDSTPNDMEVWERRSETAADQHIISVMAVLDDAIEFVLFPMVNEGFLCLEEGMIEEESLIDVMFLLGFGWPITYGGPMRWGRSVGLRKIAERVAHWQRLEPRDRSYQLSTTLDNCLRERSHL